MPISKKVPIRGYLVQNQIGPYKQNKLKYGFYSLSNEGYAEQLSNDPNRFYSNEISLKDIETNNIIWEVETIQINDLSYATVHEDLYKEIDTKITDKYFTPFQLKGKFFMRQDKDALKLQEQALMDMMKLNTGQIKVDTIAMKG